MLKFVSGIFVLSCSLAFAQNVVNSVTVTASNSLNLQPDQAIFSVTVQSGTNLGLDDVLAALQGSGITAANLSGISSLPSAFVGRMLSSTLQWTFALPAPLTKTKDTVASLTTLQQNIAKANDGLSLSFSIAGTSVSQQLAQSQTCSLPSLIASATTQAQSIAIAANRTVGQILALSSSTSSSLFFFPWRGGRQSIRVCNSATLYHNR
jgi:uncharacterized protein YggE